tara:strand:+ start:815 stop:1126 length:312 start_codon:yes stop_codon:yes gene_type:complete
MANALLLILLLAGVTVGILAAAGVFTPNSGYKQTVPPIKSQPCIDPQPFKTGYLKDSPQPLADVCNSNMYPVNPPYVNYGPRMISTVNGVKKECDVNIFNSTP